METIPVHPQWDPAKEKENIAKHGVDFMDAQQAFADPWAIILFDAVHSTTAEMRWCVIGRVGSRIMQVRYTHRPQDVVRIIGAGYWRKSRGFYENYWKEKNPEAGF